MIIVRHKNTDRLKNYKNKKEGGLYGYLTIHSSDKEIEILIEKNRGDYYVDYAEYLEKFNS